MAISDWEIGWQYRAACRGEDAELFFPETVDEPKGARAEREAMAKAICAVCTVRVECLDYALRTREPHGVWGGMNEAERRAVLRERDAAAGRRAP